MKLQLFATRALALGGVILMGMGLYFVFVRPPLLPEDTRFMGATIGQIQTTLPGLEPWLARVFGVLGGFMFATGLLTVYVAATAFRTGKHGVLAVVAVSGCLGSRFNLKTAVEANKSAERASFCPPSAPWLPRTALDLAS